MRIIWICQILLLGFSLKLQAQRPTFGKYLGGEQVLNAETKQVSQFFHRFNSEESPKGERYYPGDRLYRDRETRRQYLDILFDNSNRSISRRLKESFINDLTDSRNPQFLEFHGGQWFAEVSTKFRYKGREERVTLFMQLQKEEVGSKWVIFRAYADVFARMFLDPERRNDDPENQKFLHPMSHELDFLNLSKIFEEPTSVELYASKDYRPDHLSLLLFEAKKRNMQFVTVMDVKFHFLQIDNWYFELTDVQRPGRNRGWLITGLSEISNDKKDILLKYIYHE